MKQACRILFVCTGNAGRSQLAAAMCDMVGSPDVIVQSAGVEPWDQLHPMAVKLMMERGLSVEGRRPKPVTAVLDRAHDLVVTIGDPARDRLPRPMPGEPTIVHWDISDPADADGTPRSEAVFRDVLASIETRLPDLLTQAASLSRPTRAGLRPGVTTGVWYPDRFDPSVHLPQAVRAGFVAIELNCFLGEAHFPYRDAGAVRELKRVADDLGIEIWSIHEPANPHSPGSRDDAGRRSALDDLKLSLDLAARLGATAIPSHALVHHEFSRSGAASRDLAIEQLAALTPDIEASGARIAIENGYPDRQAVLDGFDQLPGAGFGFVIDTGHAHIAGGGAEINRVIRHVGDRMISLHLNDNDGSQDSHHPPGAGAIDWPAVAASLTEISYRGCLLWEVFSRLGGRTDDPDAVLSTTIEASRRLFPR